MTAAEYATAREAVTNLGPLMMSARVDRDLTQRDVARQVGVSQGSVWRLETGRPVSAYTISQALSWLERVESWENLNA